MTNEFEGSTRPKKYTNNFSREKFLGQGGFGYVCKRYMKESNSYIDVKGISRETNQEIKEYASEVRIIRLTHKHMVQLIGRCHQKRELLHVYEFMPNGSLDYNLYKGQSHFTCTIRFKNSEGLA
uniref:Protein kinase domain-containing protein n=1 Tax=Solanum lycopersicum TaxID=4081 RepID=A0A3Q7JAL2_SOLLC